MDTDAFRIASGISKNFGEHLREKNDLSSMGQILKEAMESDDPQALDNVMGQMLSRVKGIENRKLGVDVIQKKADRLQKGIIEQNKLESAQIIEQNKLKSAQIKKQKDIDETEEGLKAKEAAFEAEGLPKHYASLDSSVVNNLIKKQNDDSFDKKSFESLHSTLDNMVNDVGWVKSFKVLNKKDRFNQARFTSLLGGLEAHLVDMVSRGTLSNTRFNYIKDVLLPQANDNQEKIKGKLSGLKDVINLQFQDNNQNKSKTVHVRNKITGEVREVEVNE